MSAPPEGLPAPGVVWPERFAARLEGLVPRLTARRELREGAGASRILGVGEEFMGHRPYRAGEDLRRLDWNLLARSDQPFVVHTRREAAEVWWILVDQSRSMGIGEPGKLSQAVSLAVALGAIGTRVGARVQINVGSSLAVELRRGQSLAPVLSRLGGARAEEEAGLDGLLATRRPSPEAGLVALVGDGIGLTSTQVASLSRPGRQLAFLQVLAPVELDPRPVLERGGVLWHDPEGGSPRSAGDEGLAGYEHGLESWLEGWGRTAAQHGLLWRLCSSATPFEEVLTEFLGRGAL